MVVDLSATTVIRIFDAIEYPQPMQLPRTFAIDEFCKNFGGEQYRCILTDVEDCKVFDILSTRTGYQLTRYLQKEKRIDTQYVVNMIIELLFFFSGGS